MITRPYIIQIGLRPRTFSLKINVLPTFSEITQVWQCLKLVFILF